MEVRVDEIDILHYRDLLAASPQALPLLRLLAGSGVPPFLAYLAAFAEFLGAFGMLFGFLTRIAAFGLMSNMAYATVAAHMKWGFFMNWSSDPTRGHGYEYSMTLFFMALALFVGGGGNLSIDRMIASKKKQPG
jgi:putative oxidoreductase